MNSTAIYSKSGKGVQEAAGKTSALKRADRAVLSAIDGRATLAEVAQKVGKTFDREFEQLVSQMDKDGFIREVSPGAAPAAAKPAAGKPAAKPAGPTAPMDAATDLDFSSFAPAAKPASPAPRPAAPPPKAAAPAPAAKEQQSALNKAREEAESKAAAEREKQKAEAEAKVRAEMETKLRAEAEEKAKEAAAHKVKADAAAKVQAEADAKIKAARDAAVRAAAEAKAKADAEAKRAREDADRAREEADRLRRETEAKAEQARREADEMKKRLDAERKAREEAERKAKEEAEHARKQLEEERRQLEEERKRREEEERKKEEERAERRRREEEEEQARRRQREEEDRKADEERDAKRRQREEEDRKAEEELEAKRRQREEQQRQADEEERRQEEERTARRKQDQEERRKREEAEAEAEAQAEAQRAAKRKSQPEAAPAAKPAAAGGSFSDSLLNDLDNFGKKDDEERKEKEELERKSKEEAKRRAKEEAERREREEEEQRQREAEEKKRKRREEEEAREREEEEERERKKREKEEARRREDEEAQRKEEEKEKKRKKSAKAGADDDIPITDDDLDTDDVKRDQRELARAAKTAPRPKEAPRVKLPPPVSGPSVRRKPVRWGKPVAIGLFLLLVGGLGAAHLMPIDTKPYADAASQALGQPVRIGSGRLWLFGGSLQLKLQDVTVGEAKIASVSAFPTLGSLSDPKKVLNRVELEGLTLPQAAVGEALFAKARSDNFSVDRVVVRQLQLTGPLVLPKSLDADATLDASGAPSAVTVRGADGLVIKLSPKGTSVDIDVTAGGFTLPIAPQVTLSSFGMKGSATREGMQVEKWDGTLLNGNVTGTAEVRWGSRWSVDGVFTMRGINAAVFAPALLSEGRGEGTAKFQLAGADPSKLASSGRFEGTFTVNAGVLGSFDLNQALQTGGKRASGRTPFTEMTGQAVYQAGTVSLRNVTIVAGSTGNMNAGASVDIAESGALSGRIVADVRTPNQMLRATLNLGGTVKDPQVRN